MSSCVLVTLAIGNVAHISIQIRSEKKKLRMLNRKLDFNFLRELDMGDNGMDKTMFLVAMLVQQELVKKEKDVDPWLAKFDELDVNGDGVIDFDDAIDELQNELILEAGRTSANFHTKTIFLETSAPTRTSLTLTTPLMQAQVTMCEGLYIFCLSSVYLFVYILYFSRAFLYLLFDLT